MTATELKSKSKEEVQGFIRERLTTSGVKKKFEMSGYEKDTGDCTKHNLDVLNTFADLGIYDYTNYLFLDFHKGCGTLYYQYWGMNPNEEDDGYGGMTTSEIIYDVFEKTIFSGKRTRRRD